MEEVKVSEEVKLPCINCVCLAMCRNKSLLVMFNDCKLMGKFWTNYVDKSSNMQVATDMVAMCNIMNETLKMVFVPCFALDDQSDVVTFVDIETVGRDMEIQIFYKRLKTTYRVFRLSFNVDMLDMPRVRPYLLPFVKDVVRSIEG